MNVGTVEVLLQLRDKLTAELNNSVARSTTALTKLTGEIRKTENAIAKQQAAVEKAGRSHRAAADDVDRFGRQIRTTLVHVAAAAAAYKLLAAAVTAVSNQVELVRTFEKIENVTGVTRGEVDRLRSSLNDLSTSTGKGPQELAEGFYFIASAGLKGAEATEVLTAAAKASAVGLGETKDIARSITAAINAYGAENLSAAKAADILFATVREGGAEASEVAGVFGRVVGIASQLGVSFAEVGSFIATFTRLGVGADEAVTALRGSITAMLTPTRAQEAALKALGLSMAELKQQVRERGLTAALIDLVKAGKGNEDIIGAIIPNVRSLAGVLATAGSQAEAYREVTDKVTKSTGDLGRAFDDVKQSASFKWDQLKAQFEQLSLTLGEALLPGVQAFGAALAGLDRGELAQFGENAATALRGLAEIVSLLVAHLDTLQALVVGLAAIKLGSALSAWVTGLGEAAVAARVATSSTAALGASIGALAGPIAVAVAAGFYLNNKIKEWARDSLAEIANVVTETNKAGGQLQRLLTAHRGGELSGADVTQAKDDYAAAEVAAHKYRTEIDKLNESLKQTAPGQRWVIQKQIDDNERLLHAEEGRMRAARQVVQVGEQQRRVIDGMAEGWGKVGGSIKIPSAEAERYGQRLGEVTKRWSDQLAVARQALATAKATFAFKVGADGTGAELADERELSQEKRIQLEIDRRIAAVENDKHKAGAALRAAITAQVAEEIRLNDAAKDFVSLTAEVGKVIKFNTVWQGKLRDLIRDSNARLGDDMTARVANGFNAQNNALTKQLGLARELLSAWTKGGDIAARAVTIQQDTYERSKGLVSLTDDEAAALAKVADEQDRINYLISKVAELSRPAWAVYLDAAFNAIGAIGDALSDVIVQAAMKGKVDWESVWESLKSSLIKIFADMLADMLKRWIATQLAMRAASQSINGGSALGGAASAGSSGAGGAISSAGSAGGSSGASAGTLAGWAVAAFALYVVYKGFIEDHKRRFASVTLGESGQIVANAQHTKKYMDSVREAAATVLKDLQTWMHDVDVQMTSFGGVSIEHSGDWWQVRGANGVQQAFKSAEEALSFAEALMVRFGEFAGSVPSLVRAAIEGTNALGDLNMDQITSNVQFARTLLTQNMEQVASAMQDATDLFVSQMRRSFDLFASAGHLNAAALSEATGSAILYFTNSLQSLYDQLTGHKEDAKEAAERQRTAYNAQRAITIAQITLLYEEIKARIALLQVQIAAIAVMRESGVHGGGGFGGGSGQAGGGGYVGGGGGGGASPDFYAWGAFFGGLFKGGGVLLQDSRNPTNDPQLAALLQVLDNLARALAGLPPEIAPGGVKPGRGGRGGGQRDAVRDFIKDQQFQLAQAGRSPIQQELENIHRQYQEQLDAAGKNVALRQQLLDLERQSVVAAIARNQAEVKDRFNEIVGNNTALVQLHKHFADMRKDIIEAGFSAGDTADMLGRLAAAEDAAVAALQTDVEQRLADMVAGQANPFADLHKKFAAMRKDILDAGFAADKAARLVAELTTAEAAAVHTLSLQTAGDLLGSLAQYIQDEGVRAEFLTAQAQIKFELDMANYRIQFEILKANGDLSQAVLDKLQKAFDYVDAHPPVFGAPSGSTGDNGSGYWQIGSDGKWHWLTTGDGGGSGTADDPAARARDLLNQYHNEGLNAWEQALKKLNDDFDSIRLALGNTPEVMAEYAAALERLRQQFLAGIRSFYEELTTGDPMGGSGRQQFAAAQARYQQLLAVVQGGDLSQADALEGAARRYLDLAGSMFGTSTLGYTGIRDQITQQLAALLGINTVGGGNVIGGPQWFTQGVQSQLSALSSINTQSVAQVAATANVATVVDIASRRQESKLDAMIERLDSLIALGEAESATTTTSTIVAGDSRSAPVFRRG